MKTLFLTLLLTLSFNIAFSQHKQKATVEIYSLMVGKTFPYRSGSPLVGGSVDPHGNGYYNIGVNYTEPLNKWLSVLGGFEYSDHKIRTTYWLDNPNYPQPSPTYEKIQLLSFPINIQTDFLKYFYARTGFTVDVEMKNNTTYFTHQSGIGLNFEVGAKYSFRDHVTVFLSPFFQTHGNILFHSERNAYKINTSGINLGIGYRF
jgi:hypothetical protein